MRAGPEQAWLASLEPQWKEWTNRQVFWPKNPMAQQNRMKRVVSCHPEQTASRLSSQAREPSWWMRRKHSLALLAEPPKLWTMR